MDLDNRTLLVVVSFSATVQTLAMLYVWRMQLRERSVGLMTLGFALIALGTALIALRPVLPILLTVVIGNTAVLAGQALNALAICKFVGRRLSVAFPVWIAAISLAVMSVLTFVMPDLGLRIVATSILIPVSLLPGMLALMNAPPGPWRRTYWPVAGLYVFHSLFAASRGIATLAGGPASDLFSSSLVTSLWFLESFAALNLISLGLILMISQRLQLELDRQASYDGLTGTLNRRAFERVADAEWSRAVRHDLPLAVLVLDLDRFKSLNDTHGHDAGDVWLKTFAELTQGLLRREDLLCRYGGEEFLALLPQTSMDAARQAAERIRRGVEGMRLTHNGVELASTVSIGIAIRDGSSASLKTVIADADRALYRAKAAGRNRVELAPRD
jgi:diguanylate cyclase (GGDEF)-like protein